MARKIRQTTKGNVYHILSRGVDKRKIFLNDKDYLRFVYNLFEFNDTEPVCNSSYFLEKGHGSIGVRPRNGRTKKLLVEVLVFTLMPNHYHLMIRPLLENGISEFMKKINGGYASYFNKKYKRTGTLFEGRYKIIPITSQAHFIHLPYYIHTNPLDLIMPEWRDKKLGNYKKAVDFLKNYKWCSFQDYIGKENFPSVTSREFLMEIYKTSENYEKEYTKWLKEMKVSTIRGMTLE